MVSQSVCAAEGHFHGWVKPLICLESTDLLGPRGEHIRLKEADLNKLISNKNPHKARLLFSKKGKKYKSVPFQAGKILIF